MLGPAPPAAARRRQRAVRSDARGPQPVVRRPLKRRHCQVARRMCTRSTTEGWRRSEPTTSRSLLAPMYVGCATACPSWPAGKPQGSGRQAVVGLPLDVHM